MPTRTRSRVDRFLESVQDVAPCVPKGAHTQPVPFGPQPVPTGFGLSLVPPDYELYRMRSRPELYPDWLVDSVHTHRAALIERVNSHTQVVDWDCSKCKRAVVTRSTADKCPNCGW